METSRRLPTAAIALAAYVVLLLTVLLGSNAFPIWLVASTENLLLDTGVPAACVGDERVEFVYNTFALVPLSALGSSVWRRWNWRDWTAFGFVLSFSVESVQALLLPDRTATYVDVVANTLGAALGPLLIVVVDQLRSRRTDPPR